MLPILSNKRGITLIEGLIAIVITSIGLMGLLSMQSPAWRLSGKSDYMGRGAGILYKELNTQELFAMNPCNAMPTASTTTSANMNASGQSTAQAGDATFTVTTNITPFATGAGWRVTVTVTWPNNTFPLSDSVDVTRQEPFRYGGC
jgi:Tfp pilus assembly protein PilV